MPRIRLSLQGRQTLESELVRLEARRAEIGPRIQQARKQGNDLTENLDLRDAIEEFGHAEGRSAELRGLLAAPSHQAAAPDRRQRRLTVSGGLQERCLSERYGSRSTESHSTLT